jgi:predicted nuclease of predicted toxin-antitoxin system
MRRFRDVDASLGKPGLAGDPLKQMERLVVARRKSLDEWLEERRARDPNFDRDTLRILARRPPPRKIPLLCDESLEEELVADLRLVRDFKVVTLPAGRGDDFVWAQARQRGLVLLTADEDLYDDRRYPLRHSPRVIILRGSGTAQRTTALARLTAAWDLPTAWHQS